jgi:hypothetical protein
MSCERSFFVGASRVLKVLLGAGLGDAKASP